MSIVVAEHVAEVTAAGVYDFLADQRGDRNVARLVLQPHIVIKVSAGR